MRCVSSRALRIDYDILIAFPPYVAAMSYEALPRDERGFLRTELETRQVVDHPDIYAPGDGGDFPVKQAFLAFLQADAVANHIASRVKAKEFRMAFDPVSMCVMEMFDKATFAQVPLTVTGDPVRPVAVRDGRGGSLQGRRLPDVAPRQEAARRLPADAVSRRRAVPRGDGLAAHGRGAQGDERRTGGAGSWRISGLTVRSIVLVDGMSGVGVWRISRIRPTSIVLVDGYWRMSGVPGGLAASKANGTCCFSVVGPAPLRSEVRLSHDLARPA